MVGGDLLPARLGVASSSAFMVAGRDGGGAGERAKTIFGGGEEFSRQCRRRYKGCRGTGAVSVGVYGVDGFNGW
jgi:hypothetical protein